MTAPSRQRPGSGHSGHGHRRRIRRWIRTTPTGEVVATLVVLVVVGAVVLGTILFLTH